MFSSSESVDRRQHAVIPGRAAVIGLAALAGSWLLGGPLPAASSSGHHARIHRQAYTMGTTVEVLVYHPSAEEGRRAADAALAEVTRLDRVMSTFDPASELSTLNRNAGRGFVRVSRALYGVLEQSLAFSRRSGGRFDVTVGPLVRTWRIADEEGRVPSAIETEAARRCVGHERIELRAPDRVRLRSPCLAIDLGGIGKGYAVDRALAVLAGAGIRHGLVNAGRSSIGAMGHPPGETGWPVILRQTPAEVRIALRNASLSTSEIPPSSRPSGGILDPRTGAPAGHPRSVTVVAHRATTADALSTAVLMMGEAEASTMLASFEDASAAWFSAEGALTRTHGRIPFQGVAR